MTRKITHLIKEQKNKSKPFETRELDVKVEKIPKDSQKIAVPIPNTNEVLPLISRRESQQRKVTMPKEDKNQNGKRNSEIKLIGKKARKLSKKRPKIENLQKVPEGTSQKENFQNLCFIEISEQCHMALLHEEEIQPLETI